MGRLGRRTVDIAGPLRPAELAGIRALIGVIQREHAAGRRGGVTAHRRSRGAWMSTGMPRRRREARGSYSRLRNWGGGQSQWLTSPTTVNRCPVIDQPTLTAPEHIILARPAVSLTWPGCGLGAGQLKDAMRRALAAAWHRRNTGLRGPRQG
jgi:hypothetical protein